MKTRQFITALVSFLAALCFFKRKTPKPTGSFIAKHQSSSLPVNESWGYSVHYITLMRKDGIYQWRSREKAMSREFYSLEEAGLYNGPFMTDQERKERGIA